MLIAAVLMFYCDLFFLSQVSLVEMVYLDCLDEILQVAKVAKVHLVIGVLMVFLESKAQQVNCL